MKNRLGTQLRAAGADNWVVGWGWVPGARAGARGRRGADGAVPRRSCRRGADGRGSDRGVRCQPSPSARRRPSLPPHAVQLLPARLVTLRGVTIASLILRTSLSGHTTTRSSRASPCTTLRAPTTTCA